jgi:hypothetical protein
MAKKMGFSSEDFLQIKEHGINFEDIQKQRYFSIKY